MEREKDDDDDDDDEDDDREDARSEGGGDERNEVRIAMLVYALCLNSPGWRDRMWRMAWILAQKAARCQEVERVASTQALNLMLSAEVEGRFEMRGAMRS